jgi:hypothetical protein
MNITYYGTTFPQIVKIHYDIPEYLWTSSFNINYKAPSGTNLDCNTHPCSTIEFIKDTGGTSDWLGVKSDKSSKDVTQDTLPLKTLDKASNAFKRIN